MGSSALAAIAVVISYFIGNISPSILLSKMLGGDDIRNHGSGNAGTTNMLRVYGKKFAAITLIIDVLKGLCGYWVGAAAGVPYLCVVAVVIGHIWPVCFGFRGGKGIATCLGALLGVNWKMALILLGIAAIFFVTTRYISLGSIVAAVAAPILSIWFERGFVIYAVVLAAIVIYKHKDNIVRLMNHTESKVGQHAKKEDDKK